jgi:short-subunit dehydrogenase
MDSLKNKVVFITGASSGIGEALACEYSKNGANVILLARRFDLISSLAEKLSKKYQKCIAIKCDVTHDGDLEKAVFEGIKNFGKIDIVVANAGFGRPGKLEDLNLNDYKEQFETNVFGVLRTIYATLAELKKSKGSVCIMGSVNGIVSLFEGTSAYTMSKFALRGLIQPLSLELSHNNISVIHVMPGFVKTEFDKKYEKEKKQKYDWLKISAEEAALLIIKAISNKNLEVVLTKHGKIAVLIENYIPFKFKKFINSLISTK